MTNKIIAILVAAVIALSIVAYQLWQSDDTTALQPVEQRQSEPARTVDVTDNHEEEIHDKQQEPPAEVVIEDSMGQVTVKTGDDEQKPDEELCQLIDHYDDWYPKGDSYESDKFMTEVKTWAFSRGYFETEYSQGSLGIKKQSDYDYYDIDDLEEMAKAGDSMANVRLAYRLYLKGDLESMARAQPYCDRAIADGYTALVMCKSSYITTQIYQEKRKDDDQADPERLKALELEYSAWQKVSGRLGDELGSKLTEHMLPELEHEFDQETIEKNTEALIDNIESQRQQLGISERKYPPIPELLTYVLEKGEDPMTAFKACFEEQ
ncbi:hypothetical protein [Kangiella geojedonensis]|uniref:hypothetical protein n=1 Tax=Kangiella geojedonensis TaxID=914150 RepID=UPI000627323D|nr:hypothetical protein [Kangiella geojedonensis]